jgi:hypothetical protein
MVKTNSVTMLNLEEVELSAAWLLKLGGWLWRNAPRPSFGIRIRKKIWLPMLILLVQS